MEGYYTAEFGMSKRLAEVTPGLRLTDKAVMAIIQKNFRNIFRDIAEEVNRIRSILPKSELRGIEESVVK